MALLICVAWLVMVLVRRRLGPWPGLMAAALLLFMGAAWEDLLWPIEISFLGSTAAGLGAFALLDRERPPDLGVCALLVLSSCFSGLGLVFTAGVVVDVLLRGRPARPLRERLRRAWVPAVPIALYVAWYLAYGQDAESNVTFDNLVGIPNYVWTAASTVPASLLGLVEVDADSAGALITHGWGPPLLLALLIGAALLIARDPTVVSTRLWVFAATAVAFWASAGLNRSTGRDPGAPRYQLIGAVLLILISSELLRGRTFGRPLAWVAAALAALAVVAGIAGLREGADFRETQSDLDKAELSAVEVAGDQADPNLALTESITGTPFLGTVVVGPYLDAVERWGSPVGGADGVTAASEPNRARADFLLASLLGARLEPSAGGAGTNCRPLAAGDELELPADGLVIVPDDGAAEVGVRRFADTSFASVGAASTASLLRLPADGSPVPWTVQVGAPARACPPPAA